MKYGFDPELFQLQRIPTPEWAIQGVTYGERQAELEKILEMSSGEIIQRSADFLQWALTDPVAVAKFQHDYPYSGGVGGSFFVGRQHIEFDTSHSNKIIVETECCLTHLDYNSSPAIYERYNIILIWDTRLSSWHPILAHGTERESQIAKVDFRPLTTSDLTAVSRVKLTAEDRSNIEYRWEEFSACLQEAVEYAVNDGSSSGQLDDLFFPDRLRMTGEYYIDELASSDDASFNLVFHLLGHPMMEHEIDRDYVRYDFSIKTAQDGLFTYVFHGMHSI